MFMIDYLNAIFPRWGVFTTREDAQRFIDTMIENYKDAPHSMHPGSFTIFEIEVNDGTSMQVKTGAPYRRYANPR